jgi:hypothetical protein
MPGGLIMGRAMHADAGQRAVVALPLPRPAAARPVLTRAAAAEANSPAYHCGRAGPVCLRAALIRACAALTGAHDAAAESPGAFECSGVRT